MAAKKTATQRAAKRPKPRITKKPVDPAARVRQLEMELQATREDLQTTVEELRSSNEELAAANEEFSSANEELATYVAELQTSQSQLQTVNKELQVAYDNVANLLKNTDVATVFLDRTFRIKLFTPAATELFPFIDADVGRPFRDINPVAGFNDADLVDDAQLVLEHLTPRRKEIVTADGACWSRRIVAYRTTDHRIDGVAITFVNMTLHKEADEVMRRLATIVESSADAIFCKDLDGIIRTWNRGAERLYGFTQVEAVGRSVEMLVPADRKQEWDTAMARLQRGDHIEQLETERLRKDGQRIAVALTISPIHDAGGKLVGASVIARDISERKQYEKELQLQGQVAANLAEGVALVTARDGLFVYTNERYEKLFGYGPGELLGRHISTQNAGQGEEPAQTAAAIMQALRANGVWSGEVHNVRKDGSLFWSHSHISTFEHPQFGTVWIGALTDITERKQAEQALHDREARLQAILDTAMDAIITIDHQGIVQSVNTAAERMFDYAAAEIIGHHVSLLMASPDREAHAGYIARYLQTREKHVIGVTWEVVARRKDGSVFPTDLAVSEIEHMKLFVGIHRDLTQRKQLERDVVEAASLEQRRIGHDLHDTVAQEVTALNMLAKDLAAVLGRDPGKATQLVDRMTQGLQRCKRDIRAVLRGLIPVAIEKEGLMAALSDLADRTHKEGTVTCTFDCPTDVALADNLVATHLYLIAQEAVHNAVRHARAQTVSIALLANESLAIRVRDDGVGMPPVPTILQGLGLRIMRNRAAIIGAVLTIAPSEPTGTIVTCILPRKNHEREKSQGAGQGADRR